MNERGRQGEDCAARFLERKGYRILARNYRTRFGEIDLIAQQGEFLAFVEVKTRTENGWGRPAEAVSAAKQRRILLAAQEYLQLVACEWQPRFDVVEIITARGVPFLPRQIHHLEDAFCLPQGW
ncbi:MAG: YraN family protein [Oscillospiraceae bacterium]|nr:MAG: YraN family protein [Oscillospiraceae bacterium]